MGIGARTKGAVSVQMLGRSRTVGLRASGARAPRPHSKNGRLPRVPPADARPVEFVVNTDPVPKGRARTQLPKAQIIKCFMQARGNLQVFMDLLGKLKHQTFTPDRTEAFEREVAFVARRAMASRAPLAVPVNMKVTFVLRGDPGTWPTDQSDGDLDNLAKAVKDALNGIAYSDDRLVVEMTKAKICGPDPRIEIALAAAS